jgi:transcriptional regulator with XRE-family HTH domain
MDLHSVRNSLKATLETRRMTQEAFARKYDLSSSWLNKFIRGKVENPQLNSLERLQDALATEQRAS